MTSAHAIRTTFLGYQASKYCREICRQYSIRRQELRLSEHEGSGGSDNSGFDLNWISGGDRNAIFNGERNRRRIGANEVVQDRLDKHEYRRRVIWRCGRPAYAIKGV